MNIVLYGRHAGDLRPLIEAHPKLTIVDEDPEVVVCFGGDGTLLTAELTWPGVPKVPLRNSRRGIRCIGDPPEEVIADLARGALQRCEHLKLSCLLERKGETIVELEATNEFSVNRGRTNSAVRFTMAFDGVPWGGGDDGDIIGDGYVVSTPFGSTAYYNQVTRGVFWTGIGVALMYTSELANHLVVPETMKIVTRITRGPAILSHDNSPEYVDLQEGDVLTIQKAERPAVVLMPQNGPFRY